MLKGKKIVIGVTGSIAAYKIPFLVRILVKEEAQVRVIMTPAATAFVTPLTLSTLSRATVIVDPFKETTGEWNNHVELGSWADLMLFAPVTANTLGKMANGIADNFLVTAYLSAKCPVFIAPAMDLDMYNHPSTQKNIQVLRSYGNTIIEPQVGELASGLSGPGRMEEPENIMDHIRFFFDHKLQFSGNKILVTAGPTREAIDPVRYIGNRSSGLMGISIAEEASRRGAKVTLICGPGHIRSENSSIKKLYVESAAEMYKACRTSFSSADIVIMAAAVADYTPEQVSTGKIKKGTPKLTLNLVKTTDILEELGKLKKKDQVVVGFALESGNGIVNATAKLKNKNLDLIVLNSLDDKGAGFDVTTNKITIIGRSGILHAGELKDKREVAGDILDTVKNLLDGRKAVRSKKS
ncbi:MAG: bifunctional phosphopantothenoylcysteine decarboxylase/phosphopantothenate--cysteine ligase CoaBC [Bacteroidetes bacterium]|nr:bifunctional phosphopantothenoylcysteine decarboxylase/phosphopantothenate--cysteine ligase CoaBC [Bacteroidota bacterium]